MTDAPDYIVLRAATGMPVSGMGGREGRWMDRSKIPVRRLGQPDDDDGHVTTSIATATATGRFEAREDGAIAEVWEVRW